MKTKSGNSGKTRRKALVGRAGWLYIKRREAGVNDM
jgi:hypothetical protein